MKVTKESSLNLHAASIAKQRNNLLVQLARLHEHENSIIKGLNRLESEISSTGNKEEYSGFAKAHRLVLSIISGHEVNFVGDRVDSHETIQLVLCQHPRDSRVFLFKAPRDSELAIGDQVLVETCTKAGTSRAEVVNVYKTVPGSDSYNMILAASQAYLPLKKVLGKYEYVQFDVSSIDDNPVQEAEESTDDTRTEN